MQLAADESQTHTKKNTANKYCSHKRWYKNAHGPHKKYIINKITNKRQNNWVNGLPLAGLPPSLPISPRYGWQMFIALVGYIQIDIVYSRPIQSWEKQWLVEQTTAILL